MNNQKKQTKQRLRDLLICHMRAEYPSTGKDLSTIRLNKLLSDYNQFVIEETFAALQGNSKVLEYSKLDELELALVEARNINKLQLHAEIDKLIEYEAQIEELFEFTKKMNDENADSSKPEREEKSYGELTAAVYNANGTLQAEMICLFLDSFGIRSHILQESAGVTYGLTVGPLGLAEIRVSKEDSEQTREILKAMEEGVFILPEEQDDSFSEDHLVE